MARVITDSVYCPECCEPECAIGFGGASRKAGKGENPAGPCVDFDTMITTEVPQDGFYLCTGGVDDEATITWSGGSFFSPAAFPESGPCYGAHLFSFSANFTAGDKIECVAGSWGGRVGCNINCCLVPAP